MDKELQEFVESQKKLVLSSYEQAKSYSNIIMMGGYAGIFAIWSFTKNDLEQWQSMTVGLLAILSVFSFVLFEIYGLWLRSTQTFALLDQLSKAEKLNKFPDNYAKEEMRRIETMAKVWPYFFFFTLGTGVLAGLFLLWAFVSKLIG
mgnify:CR=1 FL=1